MQAQQLELRNRIKEQMKIYSNHHKEEPRLTISRLAGIVGISQAYMEKIVYGTRSCSQEVQFALSHALECTVDDIFFTIPKYETYE